MGSPPHTWRIPEPNAIIDNKLRITSTYVENTNRTLSMFEYEKDHLHIRGEYTWKQVFILIIIGSPPHTWRIPVVIAVTMDRDRITSTYVENTFGQVTTKLTT